MRDKTIRRFAISLLVLAFCAFALPLVSSSEPAFNARNLPVTGKIQRQLRAAFVAKHGSSWQKAKSILGPKNVATYYGRYRGREYATAVFSVPTSREQGQPEIFSRTIGGHWIDRGESGTQICTNTIPLPLVKLW